MNEIILIRPMKQSDIAYFSGEFAKLNWSDRKDTLQLYFEEQEATERDVLVAEYKGIPAGYVTLIPDAKQGPFSGKGIPEIKDFIVLPAYRRLGVGRLLMDGIEAIAKTKSNQVSLGVGLYSDYGSAQRMYVKRGYIPDGSGIWHSGRNLAPYENCVNDDELNLFFIKLLG
jgi:GNAT superfamily N-acetyltransferase